MAIKNKVSIVKIGSEIINAPDVLKAFLDEFARIPHTKLLVHGGGKFATDLNSKLGFESKMNEGRRITSADNLDVVVMAYAGLINKKIVSQLQANECNAIGLTGADANCIQAVRRPTNPIDYGFVGDVAQVQSETICHFLNMGLTPVFSAICHDTQGQLLNTNADTIAAELAIAMSPYYDTELTYCFDKKGVLADVNNDHSVIRTIDRNSYKMLKANETIFDGMLPKLENCFHALSHGVQKVVIGNSSVLGTPEEMYTTLTL